MKALMYTGPNSLRIENVEQPSPAENEVLVRVEAVGICGSDMHAYHGHDERRPPPLILGHEAAGHVATGPRRGERVTIDPLVTCRECIFCLDGQSNLCRQRQIISMPARPGAFAEFVRIPEHNIVAIPPGLASEKAALTEPIAVAWHAVRLGAGLLRRPLATARCVVLGGGAIGLSAALVLLHFGAKYVAMSEPNSLRRATAAAAGPIDVHAPADEAEPHSVHLVIDAVGAAATRMTASRIVRPGGAIVHAGLLPGDAGFDIRKLTLQEVAVTGTYCYTHLDFIETLGAISAGGLGPLDWFTERSLDEGADAFRDLDSGAVAAAKIVLRP